MGTYSQKRILGGGSCAQHKRHLKLESISQVGSALETLWPSSKAVEDLTCPMSSSKWSAFLLFLAGYIHGWNKSYATIQEGLF